METFLDFIDALKVNPPTTAFALIKSLNEFDWAKWEKELTKKLGPAYKRIAEEQARRTSIQYGFAADYVLDDPWTSTVMTKYVAARVTSISGTTKADLKEFIRTWLADQRPAATTAELGSKLYDDLKQKFDGYAKWRADRI